ncbi:MAG: peptidoglycan-binding protein [Clostridia bacterium]|nr:peptidoglycan-binding protein [Clostridia bacterium]
MKTIRKGSKGAEVRQLQTILGITADGIFGPITRSAVIAYQTANGLKADGIVGPLTWGRLLGEEPKPAPSFKKPVDYKQYDSKWAMKMYSSHGDKKQTMKNSACGPTAMADIVATLIDSSVTPPLLADKSMTWGDRTYSSGTAWSFFPHIAGEYKFSKYLKTASLATLKACLDSGGYAVASMGKGYWTNGGHYICVWKYDGDYIYANDPASTKRTRQKITDFNKERKALFCFWR